MNNTDVFSNPNPLQGLLDRPIAFHRCFVRLGIGMTGAVMLSQAIYWSKRTTNSEGWFHKSIEEWEEETGLTRFEQETAKRNLKGILEIERRGIPARLYFRIDWNVLEKSLNNHSLRKSSNQECDNPANKNGGTPQTRLRKSSKLDCGNPTNKNAEKDQTGLLEPRNLYKEEVLITTETTSETTLKTPPTPKSSTSQDPASGHASERGAKNPADGTRDNPKEAQSRSTKGDGSQSRQNTSSGEILLPDWLHPEDWNDYREHRASLKCPLTPLAEKKALGELERLRSSGNDPVRVISQSIVNGWKGLFPAQSSKDSQSGRQRPQTFDEIRTDNNKKAVNEFLRKRGEPTLFQEKGEINVIDL